MSAYLHYYEEQDRGYDRLREEQERADLEAACHEMAKEDNRIEELIQCYSDDCRMCYGLGQTAYGTCECVRYSQCSGYEQHPETGMVRRCILEEGHTVRHTHVINFAKPFNISKEWAKLFLVNWNRTVEVWNDGELFSEKEWPSKSTSQKYYAKICCTWLIPNGFEEPHQVAEGK